MFPIGARKETRYAQATKRKAEVLFLGQARHLFKASSQMPALPSKARWVGREGILTCGLGYSLRLPVPLSLGNSGIVQISLFKGHVL